MKPKKNWVPFPRAIHCYVSWFHRTHRRATKKAKRFYFIYWLAYIQFFIIEKKKYIITYMYKRCYTRIYKKKKNITVCYLMAQRSHLHFITISDVVRDKWIHSLRCFVKVGCFLSFIFLYFLFFSFCFV